METAFPSRATPFWKQRDFWEAELVALSARALFLVATAGMRKSVDAYAWGKVGTALLEGANPYAVTTYLNWPPFWMQVIYLLEKISAVTGLSFDSCLFSFLVIVELALIAALYVLLQKLMPEKSPGQFVLWAISLNPVCILLTCQHGNFDSLVALGIVLFLIAIVNYQSGGDPVDWLIACLMLGIAILIKTTPIVLIPLLFLGANQLRPQTVFLGGILASGPALLGLSVIYALAPIGVGKNVLAYRSFGGYFGITGVLELAGMLTLSSLYTRVFPIFLVAGIVGLIIWIRNLSGTPKQLSVVIAAAAMLALPLFGPGYGPQYLFWSIPMLAATYYSIPDRAMRRVLLIAYGITAITYIIEYSFFAPQGALAIQEWPTSATLRFIATSISTKGGQTLVRMPLFFALLAVLATIANQARRMAVSRT